MTSTTRTYPPAPQVRYDLDAIVVAAARDGGDLGAAACFANGRRVGDEWRLANIRGDAPRKHGSCVIALKGEHAGDWHDFDGGEGGGPLSALEESEGLTGRDLFAYAAELVGWSPGAPIAPSAATDCGQSRARHSARDRFHSRSCGPDRRHAGGRLSGMAAALTSRAAHDLLAHPDLTHWETKSGFPAMIGVVRDRAGETVAIHRTYLQVDPAQPNKVTKAAVSKPRMMLGKVAGGAVRLAPIERRRCSRAVRRHRDRPRRDDVMPRLAGLGDVVGLQSRTGEAAGPKPRASSSSPTTTHPAPALRAAETAARRLRGEGREVAIALPPREGEDFNDVLLREGREAVARDRRGGSAESWKRTHDARCRSASTCPIDLREPHGSLPTLRADEGDLARAVERAWSVLLASNRTPWLFRSARPADLGRARRRGPPGGRRAYRGAPAPHAGQARATGGA